MEKHTVPQNIMDVEFKLFGELTVRQFGYVAGGGFVALFFWFVLKEFPLVQYFLIAVSGGLGLALALLKVNNQPFEIWLGNYLKALLTSQKRVWRKENKPPDFLQDATLEVKSYTKTEAQLKNIDFGDKKIVEDLNADFMPHAVSVGGAAPASTDKPAVSTPTTAPALSDTYIGSLGQRVPDGGSVPSQSSIPQPEQPQYAPVTPNQNAVPVAQPAQNPAYPNVNPVPDQSYQQTQTDTSSTVFSNQPLPSGSFNDITASTLVNSNDPAANNTTTIIAPPTPQYQPAQNISVDPRFQDNNPVEKDEEKDDFSVSLEDDNDKTSESKQEDENPVSPLQQSPLQMAEQTTPAIVEPVNIDFGLNQEPQQEQPVDQIPQSVELNNPSEVPVDIQNNAVQDEISPVSQPLQYQSPDPVVSDPTPLSAGANMPVMTNTDDNAIASSNTVSIPFQNDPAALPDTNDEEIRLKEENDILRSDIEKHTNEVEDLKNEIEQSKGTFQQLSTQNTELSQKLDEYTSQIENLKNELGQSEHKYDEIINQNQNLVQQFELLKQQIQLLTQAQQSQAVQQPVVETAAQPVQSIPVQQPVMQQAPYIPPVQTQEYNYAPQQQYAPVQQNVNQLPPINQQPAQPTFQEVVYQEQPAAASPQPQVVETEQIDQYAQAQSLQTPTIYNGPSLSRKANVVSGIVKDSLDKLLPGVIIIVKNEENRTVLATKTNTLGQFITHKALDDGTYTIELTKSNYNFDRYQVTLNGQIVSTFEFIAK